MIIYLSSYINNKLIDFCNQKKLFKCIDTYKSLQLSYDILVLSEKKCIEWIDIEKNNFISINDKTSKQKQIIEYLNSLNLYQYELPNEITYPYLYNYMINIFSIYIINEEKELEKQIIELNIIYNNINSLNNQIKELYNIYIDKHNEYKLNFTIK